MICSMTKKERANPDLLLTDRSARSRVMRITKGSGLSFEDVSLMALRLLSVSATFVIIIFLLFFLPHLTDILSLHTRPQGVAFMSEFQKMRTMISRMSKQAGIGGSSGGAEEEEMVPAFAGPGGMGNRNARRAAKKKGKKGGGGGGMGFGAR